MARWIAATSRCKKEDGLDSGHPIPTRLTSSSFFFSVSSSSSFSGKGQGKEGVKENPVNTAYFFLNFFFCCFHVKVSSFLKGLGSEDKGFPPG